MFDISKVTANGVTIGGTSCNHLLRIVQIVKNEKNKIEMISQHTRNWLCNSAKPTFAGSCPDAKGFTIFK